MREKIFLFLLLCYFFIYSQEKDSIYTTIQKKLDTAIYEKSKAKLLIEAGDHFYTQQLSKAEYFYNQAYLRLNEEQIKEKGHIDEKLGLLYRRLGEFDKSYEHSVKAEKSYRTLNDTTKIAGVILDIGHLYRYLKDPIKEIKNYREGLNLLKNNNDTLLAKGLNLIGGYYLRTKKLDSALYYYGNSLELFKKLKSEKFISQVNNNISLTYSKQKKHRKAIEIRLDNLNYAKKYNNKMSLAIGYYNLSFSHLKLKEFDTSLKYIDSSLIIAKEENFKEREAKVYRAKGYIYAAINDYKKAYKNSILYKKYSDSVFNIQKQEKIREIELKSEFELEKKELEMVAHKKDLKNKSFIRILATIILLGSIIAFFVWRNYLAKARIVKEKLKNETLKKQILTQKFKTAETEVKELIADNSMRLEFIKQLSSQIRADKDETNSQDVKNYTQSLLLKLQQQISTESKFSVLHEKIEVINNEFNEKITTQFPTLTKTEREVCLLLRLNLSIKEIASIRNATAGSIKTVRYRIRKKMNVPKHQELELFIQKLKI